ncbi:TPA: hypothetical protein RPW15_001477 [Campylobacter fetus subsp. venerealis]|nr:hypothetical protein [Campylobacter fetus subsp. venerealis]HDX6253958.1 hypothetical protein [Campylobacter fetus subsp. venerealis]HDX6258146.1 hypothetical protein [Campylobacter fetus subsp. venerealis]HDX6261805.1 hypothetical protein [Campylobacter fetus subsp. venerealis]HDX6263935.1 hypothetical protein [Campylobacter fetus subsp. venerealis]
MQEEKLSFKCEMFFGRNWKYIFWGIVVAILIVAWELNSIRSQVKKLENVVYENNSKVVLTTTDGRAIKVVKTPLKAEYLKQFAVSTFVNNFIVSRFMLTDGFKKTNIQTYKDVLETSQNLGGVWKNFLNQENKEAVGQFVSYLQWLINAIARDRLPEYINIVSYQVNAFEYNENRYKIDISIKVATNSYILALAKYKNEQGQVRIRATGDFDLERSSDENPYGMLFDSFEIEMVTKGNAK